MPSNPRSEFADTLRVAYGLLRTVEDGFGIVYPYGVFQPGTVRQHLRYGDYLNAQREFQSQALPLYHDALQQFVRDGWVIEAVQILQTLSGVVAAWPSEGLMAMRDVIGHPSPLLRQATIRTLAEAYARRPMETTRFLQRSGSALSDDDLHVIRVRQDPHIGRRQVDEEQWARAGFVRIHRSHIVSLKHIEELRVDAGQMSVRVGSNELTVSRRHARQVRDLLVRRARIKPNGESQP